MLKLYLPFLAMLLGILSGCKKDDEGSHPQVALSIGAFEGTEGHGNATVLLEVTLNAASTEPVTVDFATENGNALAGEDYVATSGSLTFPAGTVVQAVSVMIVGDSLREEKEFFYVKLSNATGAGITQASGSISMLNDDQALLIAEAGYVTDTFYEGYDLVWQDEFNGAVLNPDNWGFDLGNGCPNVCGWGNNELEWYTNIDKNVWQTSGKLVIEARQESFGGSAYTSARINSQGKQEFQYGRIDIRAKLPKGQGIWPAIWMLGADIASAGWPACGEIDIMEFLGHQPTTVYGTGHWGQDFTAHHYLGSSVESTLPDYTEEFHVYSLDWKENELVWLVDDQPFFTLTPSETGAGSYAFNHPFFFILNVAVGGNWPGAPDNTTTFPQRLMVDYIRVFQQ